MSLLKYTAPAYATRLIILFIDIVLVILSIYIACILRLNFEILPGLRLLGFSVILIVAIRLITFRWFKTYAVVVRYAGAADILQVFMATAAGSLSLIGLSILLRNYGIILPISILIIDFFLLVSLMSAFRIAMPFLFHLFFSNKVDKTNVLLIGAGQLGAITRNVIRQDTNANYSIVGIIDENPDLVNKSLDGVPIYAPNKIDNIVNENKVKKAIFAIQNIRAERKNEIVDMCLDSGIQVLEVPFKSSWIHEDFKLNQLQKIQIEDLLNRDAISLYNDEIINEINNKKVLITGGAGSIGSELVRQLLKFGPAQLLVLDQAESPIVELELECKEEFDFYNMLPIVADVCDAARMENILSIYKPDVIFHAAAYKHVPIMEAYPMEAIHVNIKGTRLLADLADKFSVDKFVMVSTDKAVNPTNVMGASKRIAEIYIQSLNKRSATKFITTRFGNVLASNGSVVPRFRKQIEKGGPVTVTHRDITRYFMTIPEASQLVIEAGTMGQGGEIYLFDMGEPVKIYDLAEKMIKLSGLQPNRDINIEITGLRPGEKLYEELLSTKENSLKTHHPKITIAKVREYNFNVVKEQISSMINCINSENANKLVKRMKEIVPEFISNNSEYSKLDEELHKEREIKSALDSE